MLNPIKMEDAALIATDAGKSSVLQKRPASGVTFLSVAYRYF